MLFDTNLETILSESKSFSLEGFSISCTGKDNLPISFAPAPTETSPRLFIACRRLRRTLTIYRESMVI